MHDGISELPYQNRFEIITSARESFIDSLKAEKVGFGVLIHGSSLYGYNESLKEDPGNYDDIDSLIVLPDDIEYEEFNKQASSVLDEGSLEVVEKEIFTRALQNGEMFRFLGRKNGISTGMHCIGESAFKKIIKPGSSGYIGNLLPNKEKYSEKIYEEKSVRGEQKKFPARVVEEVSSNVLMVREYLSHRSKNDFTIGVLADKWLSGEVAYDPSGSLLRGYELLWRNFVRASIFHSPDLSNEKLIDMLHRSVRFSEKFKESLGEIIEKERERLLTQIS